jgi:hypothetical protein
MPSSNVILSSAEANVIVLTLVMELTVTGIYAGLLDLADATLEAAITTSLFRRIISLGSILSIYIDFLFYGAVGFLSV